MFKKNPSKMNLKTPKMRKKVKLKHLIYVSIIYISFAYTFYYSMQNNDKINNKEFINFLINGGRVENLSNFKLNNIINTTIDFMLNIDFSNPSTILNASILSQNNKAVETIKLEHNDDYSNVEELKEISEYIEDPNPVDINNPKIYIYNTHQLENYNNKNLEIYGITPNVLMASYILKEKLNKLGIATIVEDTNIYEFLNVNGWDYSSSYKATRLLILDKKNKYSSLEYFIDIHRDSVAKDLTTVSIDGKGYAKVLFVVGLEHDNYNANLNFANNINSLLEEYYPNISRGVLKKEGPNVNGIYNQDLSSNSLLIELGGVDNNIEEVLNTINAIADILEIYIKESN